MTLPPGPPNFAVASQAASEALSSRRRVVYLSGSRADFGLMQSTLQQAAAVVDLSVAVTGMHLDARFGHTVDDIRASGLRLCGEVPVDVHTRSPESMAAAVGVCLQGVSHLLAAVKPDVLVLLGDRGEMLAGAIAALHLGIVTLHLHGGERSGTVDEPVRHAVSKLCTYHGVATEGSRERLVHMGENPAHVQVTGAPGLDGLTALAAMSDEAFRAAVGLPRTKPFGLVLFHPVVQQANDAYVQTVALGHAIQAVGLPVLWLEPNADAGSLGVLQALDESSLPPGSVRLRHLPRPLFCAAMRHAAVVLGNSSAGIIEAASFGTPVVNIGQRQQLRERNRNVVDAVANTFGISAALQAALLQGRWPCENVYGDGRAGERIASLLATLSLNTAVLEKANTY